MRKLVEAKFNEYKENIPQNHDFKFWLAKSNLWGWVYSIFTVQGQVISKPCIVDMIDGTLRGEVPISCYSFVSGYKEIVADMKEEAAMQSNPSLKLFKRWAQMLGADEHRRSNPVVYEIGLIPCHFNSIDEELTLAFKKYSSSNLDPLEAATVLCLDIIKVYPYDEETIDMALITFMYCLTLLGYPIPELYIGEEEFNKLITPYMSDSKTYGDFYSMLLKSIYNRLDSVVIFEKQALGQEQ